jgi:hypothetical protein
MQDAAGDRSWTAAMSAPTSASPAQQCEIYAVVCDHRGKLYVPERDWAECQSRPVTVSDILTGQFDRVRRVYRNGQDVSAEIARDVERLATDGGEALPPHLVDFIEEHLGCAPVRAARMTPE